MLENIKTSRLSSGITILSDRMPGVRSVTLGFFFRTGSRFEPNELNGITHFIEHSVFKGTNSRSATEIAKEQDRLGGNLDAFTTHEETGFVLKVIDDQLEPAFELLADMLVFPRFDPSDLVNEQNVIIEEIKMNDDSPDEVLSDIFHREFFNGHALGLPITGTVETVRKFDQATTRDFHRSAFSRENLIVAAAGNVDHELLVELGIRLERSFSSLPSLDPDRFRMHSSQPSPAAPFFLETRSELEQAHLLIAAPMVTARDPRRYAADLLSGILGGGSSSRLWQEIREKRGLVYSVGSSAAMYNDCGFFSVSASASPENIRDVVKIVSDELFAIRKNGVREEELELMKDQTRAAILLELEDSASRTGSLAQCELVHGRQIPIEESLAKLNEVNQADIKQLADEFFRLELLALVAIGDVSHSSIGRDIFANAAERS